MYWSIFKMQELNYVNGKMEFVNHSKGNILDIMKKVVSKTQIKLIDGLMKISMVFSVNNALILI